MEPDLQLAVYLAEMVKALSKRTLADQLRFQEAKAKYRESGQVLDLWLGWAENHARKLAFAKDEAERAEWDDWRSEREPAPSEPG